MEKKMYISAPGGPKKSRTGNWVTRRVAITKSTLHVLLNLGLQTYSGGQQTHFKKQMPILKKNHLLYLQVHRNICVTFFPFLSRGWFVVFFPSFQVGSLGWSQN